MWQIKDLWTEQTEMLQFAANLHLSCHSTRTHVLYLKVQSSDSKCPNQNNFLELLIRLPGAENINDGTSRNTEKQERQRRFNRLQPAEFSARRLYICRTQQRGCLLTGGVCNILPQHCAHQAGIWAPKDEWGLKVAHSGANLSKFLKK